MKTCVARPFGTAKANATEVVRNGLGSPGLGYGRISVDAKLRPTVRDDPEKANVVVVTGADKIVEPVYTVRRPFTT
jgi:hypothetical protein